jgi:hypothetical protein
MPLSIAQNQLVSVLNALGLDGRKLIEDGEAEPAIYLLEQAGARLGYRFEWERFGPFSEALAADLSRLTRTDLDEPADLDIEPSGAAERVRHVIEPKLPELSLATWIRLLASVHFLRRYSGLRLDQADRPPYLQRPPFEQQMIDAALARITKLDDD